VGLQEVLSHHTPPQARKEGKTRATQPSPTNKTDTNYKGLCLFCFIVKLRVDSKRTLRKCAGGTFLVRGFAGSFKSSHAATSEKRRQDKSNPTFSHQK
jgi:hypothetical protein